MHWGVLKWLGRRCMCVREWDLQQAEVRAPAAVWKETIYIADLFIWYSMLWAEHDVGANMMQLDIIIHCTVCFNSEPDSSNNLYSKCTVKGRLQVNVRSLQFLFFTFWNFFDGSSCAWDEVLFYQFPLCLQVVILGLIKPKLKTKKCELIFQQLCKGSVLQTLKIVHFPCHPHKPKNCYTNVDNTLQNNFK